MNRVFEDQLMDIQSDMISLSLEYVENKAETVYIYVVLEDGLVSFDVFYKINGVFVELHRVNTVLDTKVDDSDNMMFSVLRYGNEDIQKLIDVYQEYNREHPTEMWLVYDVQKNRLESRYSYEGRYEKDDDLELLPSLEFEKWFEEVQGQ